ncbi:SRP40, C-terminal domain-containing protein [Hypoxylon sp. FL1284]|nr:SRP40, C-terminal domain-containing protein [Hypoxylon sp. FL1284]
MAKKKCQKKMIPVTSSSKSTCAGEKQAPPTQLMDLVETFLSDQGFNDAHRAFQKHREKKGWEQNKAKEHHSLVSVFQTWKTFASQGSTPAVVKDNPMDKITKVSSSSDESTDSDSDSESDTSSDDAEDVAMADAPVADESTSDSSESSSSDESDSSSDDSDEEEAKPAKSTTGATMPRPNPLKHSDSESEDERPQAKKAKTEASSDESSSEDSSDSEEESSEDEVKPKTASTQNDDSSSGSDSDSDSDSDSSESDSESSAKPQVDLKAAAKVPLPESDSSSDSESESEADGQKPAQALHGAASDSSVTLDKTSPVLMPSVSNPPLPPDPSTLKSNNRGSNGAAKTQNQPFSRIRKDVEIDPRLSSNAYVSHGYGEKAHQDLIITKGKGFTKEKNKKKRGSYKGGPLDINKSRSIKFED